MHENICNICGEKLEYLPMCFAAASPWPILELEPPIEEHNFAERVVQNEDLCVVDGRFFFIRGHLEIPVLDYEQNFIWSVWASVSKQSFEKITERWYEPGREEDRPFFGWLMTQVDPYQPTLHLKLKIQNRPVGTVPEFTLEPGEHELSVDQEQGVTFEQVKELLHFLLHEPGREEREALLYG